MQEGLQEIEQARKLKGWNKTSKMWLEEAKVSEATLKRFLAGKAISVENFIHLCEAVGIVDWQKLAGLRKNDDDSKTVSDNLSEAQIKYGLTVTGVFTENKKLEIESVLEALQNLLLDSQVVIKSPNNNADQQTDMN